MHTRALSLLSFLWNFSFWFSGFLTRIIFTDENGLQDKNGFLIFHNFLVVFYFVKYFNDEAGSEISFMRTPLLLTKKKVYFKDEARSRASVRN